MSVIDVGKLVPVELKDAKRTRKIEEDSERERERKAKGKNKRQRRHLGLDTHLKRAPFDQSDRRFH